MSGSDPAIELVDDRANFDSSHPEADPSHPRYEPPHLRHQPGDDWIIDTNRPYDPDDPGPYGSPGWYQDTRTGRHRRNELPDPLPPEPEPSPPSGERPSPSPRRQRFWTETDQQEHHQHQPDHHQEHRFDRLRENAWDDFMTDSAPLAAAHHQTQPRRRPALDREAGLALAMWIAVLRWLFTLIRSIRQGDGQSPSLCSPGHLGTGAAADHTQQGPQRRTPHRGRSGATDRTHQGPQAAKAAAPPLTLPTRGSDRTAMPAAMARAIAGAQRARAGVASWA